MSRAEELLNEHYVVQDPELARNYQQPIAVAAVVPGGRMGLSRTLARPTEAASPLLTRLLGPLTTPPPLIGNMFMHNEIKG